MQDVAIRVRPAAGDVCDARVSAGVAARRGGVLSGQRRAQPAALRTVRRACGKGARPDPRRQAGEIPVLRYGSGDRDGAGGGAAGGGRIRAKAAADGYASAQDGFLCYNGENTLARNGGGDRGHLSESRGGEVSDGIAFKNLCGQDGDAGSFE